MTFVDACVCCGDSLVVHATDPRELSDTPMCDDCRELGCVEDERVPCEREENEVVT